MAVVFTKNIDGFNIDYCTNLNIEDDVDNLSIAIDSPNRYSCTGLTCYECILGTKPDVDCATPIKKYFLSPDEISKYRETNPEWFI